MHSRSVHEGEGGGGRLVAIMSCWAPIGPSTIITTDIKCGHGPLGGLCVVEAQTSGSGPGWTTYLDGGLCVVEPRTSCPGPGWTAYLDGGLR